MWLGLDPCSLVGNFFFNPKNISNLPFPNSPNTHTMFEVLQIHPSFFDVIDSYKSISILAVYFVIIGLLLFRCVSIILAQWRLATKKRLNSFSLYTFAALAVCSLFATWYFMISFMVRSYQDWAIEQHHDPALSLLAKLRGWLDETYLFEQAWAAIIETEPRFWWTNQIFAFTSIWSVFLGIEGSSHLLSGHPSKMKKTHEDRLETSYYRNMVLYDPGSACGNFLCGKSIIFAGAARERAIQND